MAIWSRVGGAVSHNLWEVAADDAGKLVAKSTEKNVAHNYTNAANWQGDLSNNGLFTSMRERFLDNPNSPKGTTNKAGNLSTITETQQGVGNRYAGFRGNLKVARQNLQGNVKSLQDELSTYQMLGDEAGISAAQAALGSARREMSSLGTKEIMSYGKQAGAHTLRALKWSQEGSGMDRFKKTAALAGAYGGANVAMRGMSGGGVTYNNDGERDIAGIPFL